MNTANRSVLARINLTPRDTMRRVLAQGDGLFMVQFGTGRIIKIERDEQFEQIRRHNDAVKKLAMMEGGAK